MAAFLAGLLAGLPDALPDALPNTLPDALVDHLMHVGHYLSPSARHGPPQRVRERLLLLIRLQRQQHVLHVQRHPVKPCGRIQLVQQPYHLVEQVVPALRARAAVLGHHRELRQPRDQRPLHRLRVLLGLVDQQVLEPRHPTRVGFRAGNQLRELPRESPWFRSLIEYHRHDQRQLRLLLVLAVPLHPGHQAVMQQPQPHPAVGRGLMLE